MRGGSVQSTYVFAVMHGVNLDWSKEKRRKEIKTSDRRLEIKMAELEKINTYKMWRGYMHASFSLSYSSSSFSMLLHRALQSTRSFSGKYGSLILYLVTFVTYFIQTGMISRSLTTTTTTRLKELDKLHEGHRFAKVPERQLLEMEGPDSSKFLQGLITNHMPLISAGGDGFYTAFLTPQVNIRVEQR